MSRKPMVFSHTEVPNTCRVTGRPLPRVQKFKAGDGPAPLTDAPCKVGFAEKHLRAGDDPILKTVCAPVEPGERVDDLMDLMERVCTRTKTGVGLAAPQIGVAKRVIFLICADGKGTVRGRFLLNPAIVGCSDETNVAQEGCLSYPGVFKTIWRHDWVTVEFEDARRVQRREDFFGFPARVVQHECDHLDGVCKVGDPFYPADVEGTQGQQA